MRAKSALTKHVGKLTLTPALRDGRLVYKVTGSVTVGDESEECRKQLVARDGIEGHYTLPFMPLNGIRLNPRL
jgi:hypothetical protein